MALSLACLPVVSSSGSVWAQGKALSSNAAHGGQSGLIEPGSTAFAPVLHEYRQALFGAGRKQLDHSKYRQLLLQVRKQGQVNSLINYAGSSIKQNPGDHQSVLFLAELFVECGIKSEAEKVLTQLENASPDEQVRAECLRLRGEICLRGPEPLGSVAMLTRYTASTRNAEGYAALAEALIRQRQFELAERANNEARKRYPTYERIVLNEALLAMEREHFAEALMLIKQYRKIIPGDGFGTIIHLRLLLALKREAEAAQECANSFQYSSPSSADTLEMLGRIYSLNDNPRQAIACFSKCITLEPRRVAAWYERAGEMFKVLLYDQAIRDCQIALKLDPQLTGAKHLIERARKQKERKGDYDEL